MTGAGYAELQVTTHFSFLRGASSCEELFATAAQLGLPALGVTDRNSLAGVVRAHEAAKVTGVRLVLGTRLDLRDGTSLLVYPTDRAAYARLTRLLTIGKRRAGKGACDLGWDDVLAHGAGQVAVLLGDLPDAALGRRLGRLREGFGDRGYLALTRRFKAREHIRLGRLVALARQVRVPTVAVNDVLYHCAARRVLQDVVTCIREGCTIDDAGFRRERSFGRWLKPPEEMARLFARYPDAIARTLEIAERCRFSLDELRYTYPREIAIEGMTAQQALAHLTWQGAAQRYPAGVPAKVDAQLRHELRLIAELEYAPYFLTVYSIVRFARSRDILCQGRGSAANSAVCYVLGVTSVDPERNDLLFERFVSAERREPPDIDIDFEHDRREDVIQWVYETYGRDHAALTATIIRYRARSAVREVGKALGLPEDVTGELAKMTWAWDEEGVTETQIRELNLNSGDKRLRQTLELSRQLMGTPRHGSQHPGGFVLTLDPLIDTVPIEPAAMANRQVIEWDKDDIDALGMMKVDVLGLGMFGCLRRFFDMAAAEKGIMLDLAGIPQDDPAVYDMICRADTVGVFQIESRAQMSMLPRLKPRTLDDLTIEVAVVRPGPIQGEMVHPYLRRRDGTDPVCYPTAAFKRVLERTLGIPLFQEQAMAIAIHCAGFTPGEADQLRRSMATFKVTGGVRHFREKLVAGMIANGYSSAFAETTFAQLEGFGSYGFPMSHAASFAIIAYASAWAKHHHPDVFLAAILNAQPMGFYPAAQLIADARRHGVEVRPVDVNHSRWDCTLEGSGSGGGGAGLRPVRLGLRLAAGLREADAAKLVGARCGPYAGIGDLRHRSRIGIDALTRLADADAFGSFGLSRREAVWGIKALRDTALPLFEMADVGSGQGPIGQGPTGQDSNGHGRPMMPEPAFGLKPASAAREVVDDYAALGFSLKAHPVAFLREGLDRRGVLRAADLALVRDGRRVRTAGLVLVRQRPGSAKGVMFMTLEDESGSANLIVWPSLLERFRRVVFTAGMMGVAGRLQREGEVIHVIAERLVDLSAALAKVGTRDTMAVPQQRHDTTRGSGSDRCRLAVALNLRTQVDVVPDRRVVPERGIVIRPRNFR